MVEGNEKLDRGVLRPRGKCWGGRVRARGGNLKRSRRLRGQREKKGQGAGRAPGLQ